MKTPGENVSTSQAPADDWVHSTSWTAKNTDIKVLDSGMKIITTHICVATTYHAVN